MFIVSREKVWGKIIYSSSISRYIDGLGIGECTDPYMLDDILGEIGIDHSRVKAPYIVSIDKYDDLPSILRRNHLYVVRLGQYHSGRASFTLCRASPSYIDETISVGTLNTVEKNLEIRGKNYH